MMNTRCPSCTPTSNNIADLIVVSLRSVRAIYVIAGVRFGAGSDWPALLSARQLRFPPLVEILVKRLVVGFAAIHRDIPSVAEAVAEQH